MNKFPSLNGLRAISIIIVILSHLIRFNFYIFQREINWIPIFNGDLGVNVFFVISGFLITSLLLNEEEKYGSVSIKSFYIRRVLRIFPAYFFLLLVYFLLQLLGYLRIPAVVWATSLTYTKFLNPLVEGYTAPAWSLSIEEFFYLFWPTIFVFQQKIRKEVPLYIIGIVTMVRLYATFYPTELLNPLSIFTRSDAIAMGCFVALYKNEILEQLGRHWNVFLISSVAILVLGPWLSLLVTNSYLLQYYFFTIMSNGIIANIAIAIIMLYSIYRPRGYWYKVLNSKTFNYIGILSYSLYLWQILFLIKRTWWVTHFPQNTVLIFLTAMFSYYVIERPFLRLKSRFYTKKSIPVQAETDKLPHELLKSS